MSACCEGRRPREAEECGDLGRGSETDLSSDKQRHDGAGQMSGINVGLRWR